MFSINRRKMMLGAGAIASVALTRNPAFAAEFTLKFGNDVADSHPVNKIAKEMAAQIMNRTGGRVELQIFPSSQLGSTTDMLSQVRSGALDINAVSGAVLSTLVPVASINSVGFAFSNIDRVWEAVDGELGSYVRGEITRQTGLMATNRMWDNGFRQVTTSNRPVNSTDDLKGMKLRVPVSPLYTSMFKALGAAPTALNFAEVYSALQTKIVDGQENPLLLIETAKLYEVQKFCSLTNHIWDGFWIVANRKSMEALPADLRTTVLSIIDEAAIRQRQETAALNVNIQTQLQSRGLTFNTVDSKQFQGVLRTAGFYTEWKLKYGEQAWRALERYAGTLS